MTREELQKNAISIITSTINDKSSICLLECKTGSGKSFISLRAAENMIADKQAQAVIISVPDNALLQQMIKEHKKFKVSVPYSIAIGIGNYLDEKKLTDDFFEKFKIDKNKVVSWLDDNAPYCLVDNFLEEFGLDAEYEDFLAKEENIDANGNKVLAGFDGLLEDKNPKIIFTNHYYLISTYSLDGSEKARTLPLIIDEVHTMYDVGASITAKQFSPYKLLAQVKKLTNNQIYSKRLVDASKKLRDELDDLIKIPRKLGITKQQDIHQKMLNALFSKFSKEEVKSYFNTIGNSQKKIANIKDLLPIYLTKSELSSLSTVLEKGKNESINNYKVIVSLSTFHKYPTYTSESNPDPSWFLRSKVWSKSKGPIIGISGTIVIVEGKNDAETREIAQNRKLRQRIGFFEYEKKDINNSETNLADDMSYFNARVSTIGLKIYQSIFSKKQAHYWIGSNVPNDLDEDGTRQWATSLAMDTIYRSKGNVVLLTTSKESAELLLDAIKNERNNPFKSILSSSNGKAKNVRTEYTRLIDESPNERFCLIGDISYFTGMDLPKKYLNTLAIARIPREPHGFRRTKEIRDMNTAIRFKQGLGRALRTPDDEALILMLDGRITRPDYMVFLKLLDSMALPI